MNTVIVCAVAGFLSAMILASFDKQSTQRYVIGAIIGFFLGGFVGWLTAVFFVANDLPMREEVVYGPIKLAAMHSSDGLSGSFVWGSGSFNNRTYYNFLKIMEDGSMVPDSVPATGRVHLIEDQSLKDSGFYTIKMRVVDRTSPLFNWALQTSFRADSERYEFRVPVGTIVQKFTIN